MEVLALVLASALSLAIALFTLSKNVRSTTNRLFALVCICLIAWSTANFFSVRVEGSDALFVIRVIFSCVILQNTGFFLLSYYYPDNRKRLSTKRIVLFTLFSFLLAALLQTSFVLKAYKDVGSDTGQLVPGPGIALFILHAIIAIGLGFRNLVIRLKTSKRIARRRIIYLFAGSIELWFVVPITNFVLPIAFGFNGFVRFSAPYVLAFTIIIAYAILRHHLFDIRAAVARTVAYVLTLGFTFLLFGLLVFFMNTILFENLSLSFAQQVIFVIIALITAPSIVIAKRYFDKLTARIFYQDSYTPEAFFAELNKRLIRTIDLEEVLGEVADLLDTSLKLSKVEFFLTSAGRKLYFRFPNQGKTPDAEEVGEIIEYAKEEKRAFIDVSEEDSLLLSGFERQLAKRDTPIFLKLKTRNQNIGFVLVGSKKTGTLYSHADIKILQIASSELALAIQNALRFNEIENFNITLQQSIKKATEELRQTNAKLQALDEAKDEFISMASHQLRTPLTSVKGYLSMLSEGDAGKLNKNQLEFVNQSFASAQRMVYLIADLLNVSRLKTGKFVIEPVETYLPDVIEQEVEQLKTTAGAKKIELSYKKPAEFPKLMLDETKLRQVIMNFIDNAVYYTPSGGHINVELKVVNNMAEYTVTDDGIGVPRKEQHHLFTKFYRAGNAKKARPDGTGLGLFMAKKVIVASGGALIFKSQEGKGSTFGFSFPIKKP